MKSFLIATLLVALPATAATPEWDKGGVIFALQYGWGMWNIDRAKLAPQVGQDNADVLYSDTQNGHSASLRLGYNILGHATVEGTLSASGYRLTESTRGGGGFVAGGAHWHPLQIFLAGRDRFYDVSLFLGAGYGIMGQNRGMDGFAWQYGLGADFFVAKTIGLGAFFRSSQMNFGNFYFDYNNRNVAGNTVTLPQGSGGNFQQVGITLTLRVSP
jgi:hypothetical protein